MKQVLKQVLSLLPSRLPVGVSEFEHWSNSIIELTPGLADDDSIKFALASMIMHLGAQRSSAPKNYFVRSLRKTAANQVAHAVLTEIKIKQQEKANADKAASEAKETESARPANS